MKTLLLASVLLSAAPMAAHAQSSSAEELTRRLNGGPPTAVRPAPAPPPMPAAPVVRPTVATATQPVAAQAAPMASALAPRPVEAPGAMTTTPARAPVSPPPAPLQAPSSSRAAPAPGPLSPAAVAALPFRIELSSGVQLFEGRGAPEAKVWSVRKGTKTLAMIYAGPSSQFPIYDGEQVTAAGRVSIIVPEGARRIAMEHLFQRPVAPSEIHVWLMSLDGADREAAERIGQSVDPK